MSFADASFASRGYADRSYADAGLGVAGPPIPGSGQFAQAAYAFRAYADKTFAGSGGVPPPPPPPPTGVTGGQPKQVGRQPEQHTLLRHYPEPLSKRAARRLRKSLSDALPERSARELEALYARLVGDELPPEDVAPVAAIVEPFAESSDQALPPVPAVDFDAIARRTKTSLALAAAIGGVLELASARAAAARKQADEADDEEAIQAILKAIEDD